MAKREKGYCKDCDRDVGEENLSNRKLCYECAKRRMIEGFDYMWNISRSGRKDISRR